MVTEVPIGPDVGDRLVIDGGTVKVTPLLATPPTVTTIGPVVAALGTGAAILEALQLVGVAVVPLNLTVLEPWVAPKLEPLMVTEAPIPPDVGDTLLIDGPTVNETPLLAAPPTVTTTEPVVAPEGTGAAMLVLLQLVGVAVTPLNLTVLVPCVAPKFEPLIVTDVPTPPDVGERLLIEGLTVNVIPLLVAPPTVTTTEPVVAPAGTGAVILVALQLVGVAVTPLNLTVLVPWVAPKLEPLIVTEAPTAPDVGARLVTEGGKGTTMRESKLPLSVPSTSTSPFTALLPGTTVRFTPTHKKSRSPAASEIADEVVHVRVYFVRVVVSAVVPVAVHNSVPLALLRNAFALGNIVPKFAVFFIQRVYVREAPAGMVPETLGTPL